MICNVPRTGVLSERGLAAFPQNIVCAHNFYNYLLPHAPIFKVRLILELTNVIEPIFCNVGPICREP